MQGSAGQDIVQLTVAMIPKPPRPWLYAVGFLFCTTSSALGDQSCVVWGLMMLAACRGGSASPSGL